MLFYMQVRGLAGYYWLLRLVVSGRPGQVLLVFRLHCFCLDYAYGLTGYCLGFTVCGYVFLVDLQV